MKDKILPRIVTLAEELEAEVYIFIDRHYKKLPKTDAGKIDKNRFQTHDNDIDALRHAYVSGVYTMEYNAIVANVLGWINERNPIRYLQGTANTPEARSMDLWNNSIGRKYGERAKTRQGLFKSLPKALEKGEMITEPNDTRKPQDDNLYKDIKGRVIVIEESETGENILFFDLEKKILLSKKEFVSKIKDGDYEHYEVRDIDGEETPVSKRDGYSINNLG